MNKYYGLRLTRTFFIAASVVISISTIATIGGLGGLSILRGNQFDGIQAPNCTHHRWFDRFILLCLRAID